MKKQMANGTALSPDVELPDLPFCHDNESPSTHSLLPDDSSQSTIDTIPQDANLDSLHEGKKMAKAPVPIQAPSNGFDPRRLLDPKGFDKASRQDGEAKTPDTVRSTHTRDSTTPHRYTNGHAHPDFEFTTTTQDEDDHQEQGMGSLIEKAYNVGHREERPQKRQRLEKTEDFEDDQEKPKFSGGGGKGGDLGEYVKQKKKEGIEENGAVPNTVVDLTQGAHHLLICIAFD